MAFGCLLEIWETAVSIRNWLRARKGLELNENPKSWAIPIAAIGLLLVIGGVVAEVAYEGLSSNADAKLRSHESEVLSTAETKAGDADERASLADDRAGQALKEQERLKNENLKLQERIAVEGHRSLRIVASHTRFVDAMKPFAGQRFEIAVCPLYAKDFEIIELQSEIGNTLNGNAGWVQKEDRVSHECTTNITVQVFSTAPTSTKRAASALTDSLNSILGKYAIGSLRVVQIGEIAEPAGTLVLEPSEPDVILIRIGTHP